MGPPPTSHFHLMADTPTGVQPLPFKGVQVRCIILFSAHNKGCNNITIFIAIYYYNVPERICYIIQHLWPLKYPITSCNLHLYTISTHALQYNQEQYVSQHYHWLPI